MSASVHYIFEASRYSKKMSRISNSSIFVNIRRMVSGRFRILIPEKEISRGFRHVESNKRQRRSSFKDASPTLSATVTVVAHRRHRQWRPARRWPHG